MRLASFTELVATAIANTESRASLALLAEEQAALRRVATLVARGVPPVEIFSAVSDEVTGLFGAQAGVVRFEHEGPAVVFVGISKAIDLPVGTRWSSSREWLRRTSIAPGAPPGSTRWTGRRPAGPSQEPHVAWASSLMSEPDRCRRPFVDAMIVMSTDELLPLGLEDRLEKFTELRATAITMRKTVELATSRRRYVTASDQARRRISMIPRRSRARLVSLGLAARAAEALFLQPRRPAARFPASRNRLADAVADFRRPGADPPSDHFQRGLRPALRTLACRSRSGRP